MTPDSPSWRPERAPAGTRILGGLEPGLWMPRPTSGLRTARRFCRDPVPSIQLFLRVSWSLGEVLCPLLRGSALPGPCPPRPSEGSEECFLQPRALRVPHCAPLWVPATEPRVALGLWTAWASANVSDQGRGLSGGDFALGGLPATSRHTGFPTGVFPHVSGLLCLPQERALVETPGPLIIWDNPVLRSAD